MFNSDLSGPSVAAVLVVCLIVAAVGLVVAILYLMTLQRCLNRVSRENREMEPGMVWLNLIPLFGLGWHIYTVIKIANSVTKEAQVRGIADIGDGGRGIGLAASILNICGAVLGIIPYVGMLPSLAGFVCWIIYWVRIHNISSKLAEPVVL